MSRVDVAEVDVRGSKRKGAEEKGFHGEEFVPVQRCSAPGRGRSLHNLTTHDYLIKICRNRRRGRRQQLPSPRRQPGSHC
jgi:hypothetical protein